MRGSVAVVAALAFLAVLWIQRPIPVTAGETTAEEQGRSARRVYTVALDPGHGGTDIGAIGAGGLEEKQVVLDITRRLRDLIQARLGLQVILTRERDVDVPHDRRTEIANNFKADVFISIHANAWRGSSAHGAETFFLSDRATDESARRTAGAENTTPGGGGQGGAQGAGSDPTLQLLLWDMAQTLHLRESEAFADIVQDELNQLSGVRNRGVKQAPFLVLMGATMPAILVEVGFMSNSDDAARLSTPAYRQQIAEAIYLSLTRFRQRQAVLTGEASLP